jgi:hypothetical protein
VPFINLNRSLSDSFPPPLTSKILKMNFLKDYQFAGRSVKRKEDNVSYLLVLVDKVLNGVAVHAEVQIDNKAIEERVDALEDAVGQELLVTLGEELLETVLAQPLVLSYHVKIANESWVLPVQSEVLHSALLLLELVLVRSCLSSGTKSQYRTY